MAKGISRAVQAMCFECVAAQKEDCLGIACPLYSFRPHNNRDAIQWYELPKHQWNEASQIARVEGRLVERIDRPQTEAQKAATNKMQSALAKKRDPHHV